MGQPGRSPMKLDCLTCIVPKGQPDPPRQSKHCIGTQVTKSARGKSWFVAHESRATIDCDSNKCPLPRRSPTRYNQGSQLQPESDWPDSLRMSRPPSFLLSQNH